MRSLLWYLLSAAVVLFGAYVSLEGGAYGSLVMMGGLAMAVLTRLLLLKKPYRPEN